MKIEDEDLFKSPELQKHLLNYFLFLHLLETTKFEVIILPNTLYLSTIQKPITFTDYNNNKTNLCWERVGNHKNYSREEVEFGYLVAEEELASMLLETVKFVGGCNFKNKKYLKVILPDKGVFVTYTSPVFNFQKSYKYLQSEVAFTISDTDFFKNYPLYLLPNP